MTNVREAIIKFFPLLSITFLTAFLSVVFFVPRVRQFAIKIGAVQKGSSQHGEGQRVHSGSLPNIGGLAIFTGFIVALLVGIMVRPVLINEFRVELLAIILGAALMVIIGFIDDIWEVTPAARMAAQFVAAGILVVNGVKVDFIQNWFSLEGSPYIYLSGSYLHEIAAVVITLLWVVGFTNAFNFIDGLDGLSSGMATISSLSLLAVAIQFPDRGAAILLLAALAGSALGFLRHNYSPAKIIMGDSGAYMLGYVLAAVSILGALKVTATVTVAAPILILALPVVNITQVTLRRLSRGASPALASNDHLHDILRVRSGSKNLAVVMLWIAALGLGTLGMMLSNTPPVIMYVTIIMTVVMMASVCLWRWLEVRREKLAQS
jgi:UDP-GlcNAc:undecaprenyl-phosphate/decaprenyl-phosphate GlcNAc-1-phosphate transferase